MGEDKEGKRVGRNVSFNGMLLIKLLHTSLLAPSVRPPLWAEA